MEQLDEPDQPISGGRQEFRKRRRPSQPMVDKALQTEGSEKKKLMTTPQSSGPKATFSASNLPASKGNYSAKESESHSISSQLQQSWTKRKHDQKTAHKSLQTDPILKGRQDFKYIDEIMIPKERPAGAGKIASEFPEQVQEVEVPSIQLKIDRSQQTSCTGAILCLLQVEKDDKAQQTSFSALEFMVSSSSKKDTQTDKSPPNACVIKHPEFQPEMSSHEKIKPKSANRVLFTSETKEDTPGLLEERRREEVTIPVEEVSSVTKGASAEIDALPREKTPAVEVISAEVRPPPAEEAIENIEPSLAERLTAEAAIITANVFVLVQAQSAGQLSSMESFSPGERIRKKSYDQEGYPSAEINPFETSYPDDQALMADMSQVEILPPIVEDAHEDILSKAEPSMAEENPAEALPPLAQEAFSEEILTEIQPLSAEESPAEEAPAEMWSRPADKAHVEEVPAEAEPSSDQEAFVEEGLADIQPLSAEEALAEKTPAEVQPPTAKETPRSEAPADVQSPPNEEPPTEVQSPPAEEAPAEAESQPAEETLTEVQLPPAEEAPAEEALAEVQSPPTEEAPTEAESQPADKVPAEVQPSAAEEAPAEVQPPSTEKASDQVQPLSAEEAPTKVASAQVHSLKAEKFPADEAPTKIKFLSAETASPERPSHDIWTPIVEVSEVNSSSLGETSTEEVGPEVQPPPAEEL